uniref:Uncharacterized protein n=1 Tax=Anguilla anguilla TaxID=7936 RepID=A0A0E9QY66_ANGAN
MSGVWAKVVISTQIRIRNRLTLPLAATCGVISSMQFCLPLCRAHGTEALNKNNEPLGIVGHVYRFMGSSLTDQF